MSFSSRSTSKPTSASSMVSPGWIAAAVVVATPSAGSRATYFSPKSVFGRILAETPAGTSSRREG